MSEKRTLRQTVCIDFDGVLNKYAGFHEDELYHPRPFVEDFLCKIDDYYDIVILTSRDVNKVKSWFYQYGLEKIPVKITNEKVPAIAYIDDRAIQFKGNFNDTLKELFDFEPYWKTNKSEENTITSDYLKMVDKLEKESEENPQKTITKLHNIINLFKELEDKMVLEAYQTNRLVWQDEIRFIEMNNEED